MDNYKSKNKFVINIKFNNLKDIIKCMINNYYNIYNNSSNMSDIACGI